MMFLSKVRASVALIFFSEQGAGTYRAENK